ncbi:MAG: phospholipid-binding protein MlaC [Rhodospirillales bacterium]
MIGRRFLLAITVACLAALPATGAGAAEKTSPKQAAHFLEKMAAETLEVLRDQGATLEQREAKVRQVLRENFDLAKIGRFVLGKAWRKATPEQRAEYQRLFSEFVLRTYARRLGGYAGETFKIVKAGPLGKRDALVSTEIGRSGGPPLMAGWRIRGGPHGFKILDVIVAGISMIATQRSEFRALVSRQGVDGLIEALRLRVGKFPVKAS